MAQGVIPAVRGPRLRRWLHVAPIVFRSSPAVALLVAIPLALYYSVIHHAVAGDRGGSDFLAFWQAGRNVLHMHTPYPAIDALPAVADRFTFEPFVYPAPAAIAMVPFALLGFAPAATLFLALNIASIVVALRMLGVRDWRCYAVTFACVPAVAATALGTVSPMLLLGVAAAWRYRDRAAAVAPIVAALVVMKLFLWPLWLWLVYTRRYRAAIGAAVLGAVATFTAWAVIDFEGLRDYPRLLSRLTELVGTQSYSPFALLHAAGLSVPTAQRVVLAAGLGALGWVAYRFRATRPDNGTFVVALAAALALTPILWPHYLVLLFVPVAVAQTGFAGLWAWPLLLWFDGDGWSYGDPKRIVPALLIVAYPFVRALRARA